MASTITGEAPQPSLDLETPAGNRVALPRIFQKRHKMNVQVWLAATMTPINTTAEIDHVNNSHSGFSDVSLERSNDFPLIAMKFLLLTGRKKPDATSELFPNEIVVSVNYIEVARIYVDAATQTVGWAAFQHPGTTGDGRFVLDGTPGNGVLSFQMAAYDPALELQVIVGGTD